jgi:hypothetical protein
MLWELCSLEKLPPDDAGQRRRMLRRARIDTDLVTIIDKALDRDLSRRYPDAGALAADLKAFKAGARIAARRYSLLALLAVLQPPTPGSPYIVSGDSSGELRTWAPPDSVARVALRLGGTMSRAFPLAGDGPVIAIGSTPTIAWYRGADQSGEVPGHNPWHNKLAVSKQQPRIVTFGLDDELELWSFDGEPTRRMLRTHHGPVASVVYAANAPRFTVASRDGSLEEWSSDGEPYRELGSIHEPIAFLLALPGAGGVVVIATSGSLWLSDGGKLGYVGRQPGTIASIAASIDSRWLAIADPRGVVHLYDLLTRELSIFSSPHPSSQFLMFTPDSTTLAIATNKRVVLRPVPYATQPSGGTSWSWNDIELSASQLGFSADGAWFTAISDRGIWFQRRETNRWIYYPTGTSKLQFGYFSSDGRRFVATDAGGLALVFDMRASLFEDRVSD